MADPKVPISLGAKVSDASVGEFVIFRNLTVGGKVTGPVSGSDGGIILTPAPSIQWNNGDLIQCEIRGRLQGVAQKNIKSGKAEFKSSEIAAVADTTTPGVSL